MDYGASLVEPGTLYYFNYTLKNCHAFKEKYYYIYYNAAVLASIIVVVYIFIRFNYTSKLTPSEIAKRELIKQQYIYSKVKKYNASTKLTNNNQPIIDEFNPMPYTSDTTQYII